MSWEEWLKHWFVDFGWFGFHPFSAILLLIPFMFVLWRTRRLGVWCLVYSTAAVTLSIHFYEVCHSITQICFSGFVSPTLIMNVIILVGVFVFVSILDRYRRTFWINSITVVVFCLVTLSFFMLGLSGFFFDYPYTIEWGWEMIYTKVSSEVFICSLFLGKGDV